MLDLVSGRVVYNEREALLAGKIAPAPNFAALEVMMTGGILD
jgi:hypothetical protein